MRYSLPPLFNPIFRSSSSAYSSGITKFLILHGTILLALLLITSGIIIFKIASAYLESAYSRNAQLRALAQANEVNQLLTAGRHELEYISRGALSAEEMVNHFSRKDLAERNMYREIAFQGKTGEERFVVINDGSSVITTLVRQVESTLSEIFPSNKFFQDKPKEFVHISDPVEVMYHAIPSKGVVNDIVMHVIRLTKSVFSDEGEYRGQLTISIDLEQIKKILSLHVSTQSPLFIFPQANQNKKSFFFDTSGWLLFQSESMQSDSNDMTVNELRMGLHGDFGRPGFSTAFRPDLKNALYWTIVADVQKGKSGQILSDGFFANSATTAKNLYLSYVPIVFPEIPGTLRTIGGIGSLDTSYMFTVAIEEVMWILTIILGISLILVFFSMYYLSIRICRPLRLLTEAIGIRLGEDDPSPITFSTPFFEVSEFQKSLNTLLLQLQIARSDAILREELYESDWMSQQVNLEKEIAKSSDLEPELLTMPLCGIVGGGQAVAMLRQQIQKASRVLADVLIIGETGTGKELAAEAIHAASHRAAGPFISINCGALDENLLMDALFGHIKGAFSEASSDRMGAFIAASGGTLHLDEIANASPKVQQAMLRALSVRRIRPLGSDKEILFDARIVAATNIDLLQLALAGKFREDLYYRLAVITIVMPPLRRRKEDILVLIKYFLEESCAVTGQPSAGISRGAIEKMVNYQWPGNIRELKNCLTRSLAFADGNLLTAAHILFGKGEDDVQSMPPAAVKFLRGKISSDDQKSLLEKTEEVQEQIPPQEPAADLELNDRQCKVWPLIARHGGITRAEYQADMGKEISIRTAQYDLQDLVARGLLKKTGRGPASRYIVK